MGRRLDTKRARRFVENAEFLWHQRFHLTPEVVTPGVHDIEWLAQTAGLPEDLSGLSVLDIGTTNGGAAFIAEQRGATVTATDIVPDTHFGFAELRDLLGSNVRFIESSIYELPEQLDGETFDLIIFWGVLYHLRHPLLGLDCLRRLAHGEVFIETAVSDQDMPAVSDRPAVRCDDDPLGIGDETNWFIPNLRALRRWVTHAGFEVAVAKAWPEPPSRAHVHARVSPKPPRYVEHDNAFERPLSVRTVDLEELSYPEEPASPLRMIWAKLRP